MREKRGFWCQVLILGLSLSMIPANDVSAMKIRYNIEALSGIRSQTNLNSLEEFNSGFLIDREAAETKIAMLQAADSALMEIQDRLSYLKESVSLRADEDSVAVTDREKLQQEEEELLAEIDSIAKTTNYHDIKILDGSLAEVNSQVRVIAVAEKIGNGNSTEIQVETVADADGNSAYELTISGTTDNGESYSATLNIADSDAVDETFIFRAGNLKESGTAVYGVSDGENYVNAVIVNGDAEGNCWVDNQIVITEDKIVANLNFGTTVVQTDGNVDFVKDGETYLLAFDKETNELQDIYGTVKAGDKVCGLDEMFILVDNEIVSEAEMNLNETLEESVGDSEQQNGTSEQNQEAEMVSLPDVTNEGLGISDIDLSSQQGAQAALERLNVADSQVSELRAGLSAQQNRLEYTGNLLDQLNTDGQNETNAAEEMVEYARENVLIQASQDMLSQNNTGSLLDEMLSGR